MRNTSNDYLTIILKTCDSQKHSFTVLVMKKKCPSLYRPRSMPSPLRIPVFYYLNTSTWPLKVTDFPVMQHLICRFLRRSQYQIFPWNSCRQTCVVNVLPWKWHICDNFRLRVNDGLYEVLEVPAVCTRGAVQEETLLTSLTQWYYSVLSVEGKC